MTLTETIARSSAGHELLFVVIGDFHERVEALMSPPLQLAK
jgi:hypothetical protein